MEKNNKTLVSWILDILRGSVIGISNDIPGVSGGTMAVTMGIYDRIIYDVNNFRKNWRKALMDLLPILVGVLVGIFGFARILKPLIGDEGQVPPPITLMPTIFAFIGPFFTWCLEKGHMAGEKLKQKASKKGLFLALLLFVGIPIPGTGAWTGTLAASILDMDFKSSVCAVMLGVILAAIIMGVGSLTVLHFV